ncbi:MAG: hypothetical protein WC734_06240 [Patescibacteria group bacterium]|jgi:hypothetical protein
MPASLKILVPEATVNFIENPALRYNTNGWNASGSVITRVLDYARFGIASLKVVTSGSVISEGAYYRVNYLSGTYDIVTISAYVRGAGFVRIRLTDSGSGKEWSSNSAQLRDERWTRISVSGRIEGGNDVRLYVETYENTAKTRTFYVDGAQMEIKPYATSYCDGSRDGCRWDGIDPGKSLREAYTREGGQWKNVIGIEQELENLYATMTTGFGMDEIVNNRQQNAWMPGGFLDNIKKNERLLSIIFHVKNRDFSRPCDRDLSLRRLHDLRQMLIDIIKPDGVGGNQPFWIEYQDGSIPVYAKVYYDGGLEGDWDIRNQWVMDFPLRLMATSPMFVEDNQQSAQFDFSDTKIFSGVAGRIDGAWNYLNGGIWNNYEPAAVPNDTVDGTVKDMHIGTRGEVYAVGRFKLLNYNGVLSPNVAADCAAYWDGYKWTAF